MKQESMVASMTESAYMEKSKVANVVLWLGRVLEELMFAQVPLFVYEDNHGCMNCTRNKNPTNILISAIILRFISLKFLLKPVCLPSDYTKAGLLTKPISCRKVLVLRPWVGSLHGYYRITSRLPFHLHIVIHWIVSKCDFMPKNWEKGPSVQVNDHIFLLFLLRSHCTVNTAGHYRMVSVEFPLFL